MIENPNVRYYSYEKISDMLRHGFLLEPIFRNDIEQGFTVVLFAEPENADPILMNVFHTIDQLREIDQRREQMRSHFDQNFGRDSK